MSCAIPQSVYTDCRKHSKSRINFNNFNTFNNVEVHLAWCPIKEAEKRRINRFKKTERNVPKQFFNKCHNEVLDTFELLKKNFSHIKRIRKFNTLTNKVEYDSKEKES